MQRDAARQKSWRTKRKTKMPLEHVRELVQANRTKNASNALRKGLANEARGFSYALGVGGKL